MYKIVTRYSQSYHATCGYEQAPPTKYIIYTEEPPIHHMQIKGYVTVVRKDSESLLFCLYHEHVMNGCDAKYMPS